MTTQAEFYETHAVDGQLTDAQMAQLLELSEGDTSTPLDSGTPDAASDDTSTPDSAQAANEIDPAKAIVLAKDGVHTIEYSKLVEARDGEKHWKAQAVAAQQELDTLKAQAQQRADAGQSATATDQAVATATAAIEAGAVDPDIFGDFSEEALAKGIQKLVAMGVQTATAQMRGELSSVVEPLQRQKAVTAQEAHYQAIYSKHADADSVAESKELADWISKQPSFARAGYQSVLGNGTAAEVIELFDSFKAATGRTQPVTAQKSAAAAAKAAIDNAKSAVPASLSDFPGMPAGSGDEIESMRNMTGNDLMAKLEGKTPDQINALMARLI